MLTPAAMSSFATITANDWWKPQDKFTYRLWWYDFSGRLVAITLCASIQRANRIADVWSDEYSIAIERQA